MNVCDEWVRADESLTWQDGEVELVVVWSSSLQRWAWRAFDLETGLLLGSGTELDYLRAEGAAMRSVAR